MCGRQSPEAQKRRWLGSLGKDTRVEEEAASKVKQGSLHHTWRDRNLEHRLQVRKLVRPVWSPACPCRAHPSTTACHPQCMAGSLGFQNGKPHLGPSQETSLKNSLPARPDTSLSLSQPSRQKALEVKAGLRILQFSLGAGTSAIGEMAGMNT